MPSHIQDTIDGVNAIVTVSVTQEEATDKFNEEFKKYGKTAEIKGFRKGKVPTSYLKKTMGSSLLYKLVSDMILKELDEYIKSTSILGRPVMADDTVKYDFNPDTITDYDLKFNVALHPEIQLQGLDDTTSFTKYKIKIADKEVDEQYERLAKRLSKSKEIEEGQIEENDVITLHLEELEEGALKENGITNDFQVAFGDLTESAKETLSGKEKGFVFDCNIYQLENNSTPEDVQQYVLGNKDIDLSTVNDTFRATVTAITRAVVTEPDQEFFDKMFGPDKVHNVEEAKEEIRVASEKDLDKEALDLLYYDMQSWLMENHQFPLPTEALRKWMDHENMEADKAPETDAEFARSLESIRWHLLSGKINKEYNLDVTYEDVFEYNREKFGYMGQDDEFIKMVTEWTMKEEKTANQVTSEIIKAKQLAQFVSLFHIDTEEVDLNQFNALVSQRRDTSQIAESVGENTVPIEG